MELTLAGGAVIDIASREDIAQHHERLERALARPCVHGQRREGSRAPVANLATLIDLGTPPMGMMWIPQYLCVFGNDPFGGPIANVNAAAFAGSLPRTAALAIGPPVTGLSLGDVLQTSVAVPSTTPLGTDKGPIYAQEHFYVVFGGSGLLAGAANYWATAFVLELAQTDEALA